MNDDSIKIFFNSKGKDTNSLITKEQDIRDEGIAIGSEQGRNDKIAIVQRLLQKDYSISR